MQYFYIVVYTIVGDDVAICKVGLNPHQLIEWGRREATKHQDRTYRLYRQPITRTGTLVFYKYLEPYNPTIQHIESDFNWMYLKHNKDLILISMLLDNCILCSDSSERRHKAEF